MPLQKNIELKKYTTFGIEVLARYFSTFTSAEQLQLLLDSSKNSGPIMILGGGSNVLFTKDFDGVILKNDIPGITITHEDDEYVYVRAGAGVNWHSFVIFCVDRGYGGVENLSLIPGNVGASPMQNIGAYGVEIKDVFYELEAYNLGKRSLHIFTASDCEFDYRESVFKKKYKGMFAILHVTFRLRKNPVFNISYGAIEDELKKMQVAELSIKAISDAVISIRNSKLPDPALIGNAGSFFKNPEIGGHQLQELKGFEPGVPFYQINDDTFKIPAGWLIEKCGWKGYRKGDAGCYEKQALVLVNYGNAKGKDILDLSEKIKDSVHEKFKITLDTEVNVI